MESGRESVETFPNGFEASIVASIYRDDATTEIASSAVRIDMATDDDALSDRKSLIGSDASTTQAISSANPVSEKDDIIAPHQSCEITEMIDYYDTKADMPPFNSGGIVHSPTLSS